MCSSDLEQFVERILAGRPKIKREELEPIADGRVLSGKQALEAGLVDSLGSFDDAINLAKDKAGIAEGTVELFGKKGLLESILGAVTKKTSLTSQLGLTPLSLFSHGPAYLYSQ